jgi:hypothetical protein
MKIDSKTKQQLLYLASKLPVVMMQTHEKHFLTKEELEESGYVGAEELEDGRYLYMYPVQLAQNHYRCLRKAFIDGGIEAVGKYIDNVKKLPNA